MRAPLLLLALLPLAACSHRATSGSASRRCAPDRVDPALAVYGTVYTACQVDQPARLQPATTSSVDRAESAERMTGPRPRSGSESCSSAQVEFVVDEEGRPVVASVHLLRSTDAAFGASTVRAVERLRYSPARKGGEPVRQVTQWSRGVATRVTVSSSPSASPGRAPRC